MQMKARAGGGRMGDAWDHRKTLPRRSLRVNQTSYEFSKKMKRTTFLSERWEGGKMKILAHIAPPG